MEARNKPDNVIQELLVVENPRVIRLIMSEKHNVILKQITSQERSISEIARALNLNPGSVHYYLKELERQGLAVQVRQEISGGVVKKFYRAKAKRIVLASPDFEDPAFQRLSLDNQISEQCLKSIEAFGYEMDPQDSEEAKELLIRFEHRLKAIFREVESYRPEKEIEATPPMALHQLMVHVRAMEDPELGRIYSLFKKLFRKVE